ncbi:F-box domain-containing protein [Magnaporthiopsis poae ATCC 64411]|uniref:F-box domain-containing protein n=1 Tax=Magnaporthiopsis poae (strain ATCC 64411 / 73-15) TaxID=644358 RepID=A0A0C4E3I1_MAGP6|nr:F-box domain-containing protein [Magnaporthiopsis poae ATCC 64411]
MPAENLPLPSARLGAASPDRGRSKPHASTMTRRNLPGLPEEILLNILSFLEPRDVTRLQAVSRKFCSLFRDNVFWRSICFQESSFLEAFNRRAALLSRGRFPFDYFHPPRDHGGDGDASLGRRVSTSPPQPLVSSNEERNAMENERARLVANWDLTYPGENVSWYDEYIQRHGHITVSWFQLPRTRDGDRVSEPIEARGVALYSPDDPWATTTGSGSGALFAVSPLDDGSVCLWDVNGSKGRRGATYKKSQAEILYVDGPGRDNRRRSKRVDSGVTECVAVDSHRKRAFVAVQCHLLEIDLETLKVVGSESFPWSITTLSATNPTLPLTVGTTLGVHLYDYRARGSAATAVLSSGVDGGIDGFDRLEANDHYRRSVRALFNDEPLPPCASLAQPGPLSILHLDRSGAAAWAGDDIYVAGRFSNILHYDRRKFPSISGSIFSGARLCAMTSLPYPFSASDSEQRRKGQLSLNQVNAIKADRCGSTLVACGEYNTKGSLELYSLRPETTLQGGGGGTTKSDDWMLKNRQTSSQSKLLSVANHGTRLVFSNGSGVLKWFERDGFTEVRRCRIGDCEVSGANNASDGAQPQGLSLFSSMPGSDDLARKLLPTRPGRGGSGAVNENDIVFWTGEKLGLVGFSAKAGFTTDEFEEEARSAEELEKQRAERDYSERVQRALQRQAEDARFVQGLGLGAGV